MSRRGAEGATKGLSKFLSGKEAVMADISAAAPGGGGFLISQPLILACIRSSCSWHVKVTLRYA